MLVEFDIGDDGDAQLTQVIRLIGQIWIGGYRQYGEKYRRGNRGEKRCCSQQRPKLIYKESSKNVPTSLC